jgi:hypothetical protein
MCLGTRIQRFSHPEIPNYLFDFDNIFLYRITLVIYRLMFPITGVQSQEPASSILYSSWQILLWARRKSINLEPKNSSTSQYILAKYGLVNAFKQHTSKTLHHIMALQTKCPPTHLPQDISQLELQVITTRRQRFCSLPKISSFSVIFKKIRLRQKIETITSEGTWYN